MNSLDPHNHTFLKSFLLGGFSRSFGLRVDCRSTTTLSSLVVCFILLLLPRLAFAIEWVDPKLEWHSITTEHFVITYHQGEEELARRLSVRAEKIHEVLKQELLHEPHQRTQVVLIDRQDDPNGYSTPVPYNTIVLYPTAPEASSPLDNYEDWLTSLFVHEYTHTLHMDTISGLPKIARWLMGTIISPNSLQPRWILEGFATLQETRQTLGGRGRSSYTAMLLRMAALEGRFPSIDQADGYGSLWPMGRLPYHFGAAFEQWVASRYGKKKWTELSHRNGQSPIPYMVDWHAHRSFGTTLVRMWKRWEKDVTAQSRAIAAERSSKGLTRATRISAPDSNVTAARFAPKSHEIVFAESPPDGPPALIKTDLEGKAREVLLTDHAPTSLSFDSDGRRVYFASTTRLEIFNRFDDIFAYDFKTKKLTRVTRGKRARDPAMSPDGSQLLLVVNGLGQTNLNVLRIDGAFRPLSSSSDYTQYSTPRFAPDGGSFVASVWRPGGYRDLCRFDPNGSLLEQFTLDRASDEDPTFSPEGRYLLWSSDRDGISNIYALDLRHGGDTYRVTNVLGGAFHPSISSDSKYLIFLGYDSLGLHVYRTNFEPTSWERVDISSPFLPAEGVSPATPRTPLQPAAAVARSITSVPAEPAHITMDKGTLTPSPADSLLARNNDEALPPLSAPALKDKLEESSPALEVKRYSPLPTLPPRFVVPMGYLTESGALGGLYTFGNDLLSKHNYSASLTYRTDSAFFGYSFAYANQQMSKPVRLNLSTTSVSLGTIPRTTSEGATASAEGGAVDDSFKYYEVRTRWNLGVSFPFTTRREAFVGYVYECREPLEEFPELGSSSPYDVNPFTCARPLETLPEGYEAESVPARGRFAGLGLNYRSRKLEYYRLSISPEDGWKLDVGFQLHARFLGGDFNRATLRLDGRRYLGLPASRLRFLGGHVLALRGGAGLAMGDKLAQPSFRLGGSFGDNPALLYPDEYYPLRGYPVSSSEGEAFALANVEYRFPIWHVDRGLWTAPVFLSALSGALYADSGLAIDLPSLDSLQSENIWQDWLQRGKLGIGAELRADVVLSYGVPMTLRGGFGLGLTDGGYRFTDAGAWYFQIGSYF